MFDFCTWQSHANGGHFMYSSEPTKLAVTFADRDRFISLKFGDLFATRRRWCRIWLMSDAVCWSYKMYTLNNFILCCLILQKDTKLSVIIFLSFVWLVIDYYLYLYLGHIIDNEMHDNGDVWRELKCLFTRTNILIRRFARCSVDVKIMLFRCICFFQYCFME